MQAASASPGGTLFVVATPIGNLADLSPRALATLKSVAAVCAEDTRHTRQLLAHYGVEKPLLALHEHNEGEIADKLVARLAAGDSLALVSDAGTPLVSDPGYRLVRAARAAGIKVSPIPGASAVIAALSVAGLASDRFVFEGFLPAKAAARRERLAQNIKSIQAVISPYDKRDTGQRRCASCPLANRVGGEMKSNDFSASRERPLRCIICSCQKSPAGIS